MQITGGSTFIVSLPKNWARKTGIEAGASVEILERADGTLVINPGTGKGEEQRGHLDITGLYEGDLERAVIGKYLAGYNLIELRSKRITSNQKQGVRRICKKLIGPEIIEETSDRVLIQDLLNPDELSMDKSVQRMYMIAIAMHKDAIKALRGMELDLARDVSNRDDEVDRLSLLIAKQFKTALRRAHLTSSDELSLEEGLDLRFAANTIERIADHAKRMADVLIDLEDARVDDHIVDMFEEASELSHEIIKRAVESLFEEDMTKANAAIGMRDEVVRDVRRLHESLLDLDANMAVALGTLADSIERSADYGANIAEIAINSTLSHNHLENVE